MSIPNAPTPPRTPEDDPYSYDIYVANADRKGWTFLGSYDDADDATKWGAANARNYGRPIQIEPVLKVAKAA